MSEAGFLAQSSKRPVSLLAVIALHGAAITSLALSRMDVPVVKVFTPLEIKPVPVEPDPPPVPVEPTKTKQTPALVDSMKPLVDLPPQPDSLVRPEPDRIIPIEPIPRSEEHTSELQSLMRISYAVFCLKKKKKKMTKHTNYVDTTTTEHKYSKK